MHRKRIPSPPAPALGHSTRRALSLSCSLVAAVTGSALLPTPASAQWTDKTTTTPIDIQDGFGPLGDTFPYHGLAYCCPTSVTMSLSYLGVNGFNQLAPLTPTAADGLNLDRIISGMMQTGSIGGTAANPFLSGIQNYLAAKGISTANYTLTTYTAPTLSLLNSINNNQTVVDLVFGYYDPSNVRIDGHCVALDNQGVNVQDQSSPNTLAINNPKPGTFAPLPDLPSTSLEYINTVPTSGNDAGDGAIQIDNTQYPGFGGTSRIVLETAYALTINPNQLSINNPAPSLWTLSGVAVLNTNGGLLNVIAPMAGAYGFYSVQPGTLEFDAPNNTTGTNYGFGVTLKSTIAAGTPFGTGTLQLQTTTLQLAPTPDPSAAAFTAASGTGNQLLYSGTCTIALNRDSHASLALTLGGNVDGVTPNFVRSANGTLLITAFDGTAALGFLDTLTVSGSAANLPAVIHGIVSLSILAQDTDAGASADFLNYTSNGFVKATYLSSDTTPLAAVSSLTVYNVNTDITVGSNATAHVYAITIGSHNVAGGTNSTLDVGPQAAGQAGVILNGGSISTTNLNFGPAEGLIYTSRFGGTISSVIQGSGGITTFGPGNLTLLTANTYTVATTIQSGTLIASNFSGNGSVTGAGPVIVSQSATLQIYGANSVAGGAGGTTINPAGTLLLSGGTLAGPLSLQPGAFLKGRGTISGPATILGTIGGDSSPQSITFTGNVSMSSTTIYDWRLNALDDAPAHAGTNWSLLTFTGPSNILGTSTKPINFTIDMPSYLPDPNSGNLFWDQSHQWLIISAGSLSIYYTGGTPSFLQGYFTLPSTLSSGQVSLAYVPFPATSTTWSSGGSGSWALTSNWAGQTFAKHVGDTANFTTFSAPATITLDGSWTLGNINFQSPFNLNIAPGANGMLTLNNGSNTSLVHNTGGTVTLSAPLTLFSPATFQTTQPSDIITLAGPVTGPNSITSTGPGTLALASANTYQGNTTITSGNLLIAAATALPSTTNLTLGSSSTSASAHFMPNLAASKIKSLSLLNNSQLDLANDSLIIEAPDAATKSTDLAQLINDVSTARNNNAWNGPGLTSSTVAANPTQLSIAIVDNASLPTPFTTFAGQPVDLFSILVTPALLGDTNLSGTVDLNDLNTVLNHLGQSTPFWTDGNFDYAPTIDLNDLNAVLNNLGTTYANNATVQFAESLTTATPEPASLGVLLPAIILLKRRQPTIRPEK